VLDGGHESNQRWGECPAEDGQGQYLRQRSERQNGKGAEMLAAGTAAIAASLALGVGGARRVSMARHGRAVEGLGALAAIMESYPSHPRQGAEEKGERQQAAKPTTQAHGDNVAQNLWMGVCMGQTLARDQKSVN
jgi:hypothetical protein